MSRRKTRPDISLNGCLWSRNFTHALALNSLCIANFARVLPTFGIHLHDQRIYLYLQSTRFSDCLRTASVGPAALEHRDSTNGSVF